MGKKYTTNFKSKREITMGKFEDNLITLIVMWILRWIFSNEKNRDAFEQRAIRKTSKWMSTKKKESESQ